MSYREYWKELNEEVEERNSLVFGRIQEIMTETSVGELYQDYFSKAATRIANVEKIYTLWETEELSKLSLEELKQWNRVMFEELYEEHYQHSYANPAYAVEKFGAEIGQVLCLLYSKIEEMTALAYEGKKFFITITEELFVQVYNSFLEEELEVPIKIVSVGPDRDQTIIRYEE